MALKPTKQHVPVLTEKQVLEMRGRYFRNNTPLRSLMADYHVSKGTVINALYGRGAFYASIEDDIPDLEKENRMRYDSKYSLTRMRQESKRIHHKSRRTRIREE